MARVSVLLHFMDAAIEDPSAPTTAADDYYAHLADSSLTVTEAALHEMVYWPHFHSQLLLRHWLVYGFPVYA